MLSVIIPASNEAGYIGACLTALFVSGVKAEAIVVANGCRDTTAEVARSHAALAKAQGWSLTVLDLAQGGKPNALNQGDRAAKYPLRAYLDADVTVSPNLMPALATALQTETPLYATGTPRIPRARSAVTRAYARFWQKLPFAQSNAPGYGLFATNAPGRARWGDFPAIISDDTFVRLQFAAEERLQCRETYDWPMIEGFAALTRVRRRQNAGVAEIESLYPGLLAREGKAPLTPGHLTALALRDPAGFATYAAVSLAVKTGRSAGWTRGR
ncbi:MAG: glycosyltransferase [Cypionkella sp.]